MPYSENQMYEISQSMSDRDFEVLELLAKTKCIYTEQIRRILFANSKTDNAGTRAANRSLAKLKEYKLVESLSRRTGGVNGGSSGYIWYLTETGYRMLRFQALNEKPDGARDRFIVPSMLTLKHRIMESEVYMRTVEIERMGKFTFREVQMEPDTWRDYVHYGKKLKLKPDMFIKCFDGKYEMSYFLEVDLSTENQNAIIQKCERYHDYFHTKAEQNKHGVFPLVLWIVLNEKRKKQLTELISKQYKKTVHMFYVCTFDEFEKTITTDIDNLTLI